MSGTSFIPRTDAEKLAWLTNFKTKLPIYATPLGITATTVTQVMTDFTVFNTLMAWLDAMKNYTQSVTSFKNQVRDGSAALGTLPPLPTLPVLPAGAKSDIFGRVRLLVQAIKANPVYTEAIGNDL